MAEKIRYTIAEYNCGNSCVLINSCDDNGVAADDIDDNGVTSVVEHATEMLLQARVQHVKRVREIAAA